MNSVKMKCFIYFSVVKNTSERASAQLGIGGVFFVTSL